MSRIILNSFNIMAKTINAPSTTGNPSGKGRGNNPPAPKK
jgi:hypothetical protein